MQEVTTDKIQKIAIYTQGQTGHLYLIRFLAPRDQGSERLYRPEIREDCSEGVFSGHDRTNMIILMSTCHPWLSAQDQAG